MMKNHALFLACLSSAAFMGCELAQPDLTTCTRFEKYCVNNTFFFCPDGKELITQKCDFGCDETTNECVLKQGEECNIDKCDEGNNTIIKKCMNKKFIPERCPEGFICIEDQCINTNAECTDNAIQCVDNKHYKKCIDGQWGVPTSCKDPTPICKDIGDTGLGECAPDNESCKPVCDGIKIRDCDNDGNLQATQPCPAGQLCIDTGTGAVCAPQENECDPGAMKCSDATNKPNTYQKCDDNGKWGDAEYCPKNYPVCSGEDGNAECKKDRPQPACENDTMMCNDDNSGYYQCVDGQWNMSEQNTCPTDKPACSGDPGMAECKEKPSVAVCNIGEFRCISSLSKGQENLEYCDGTGWKQVDTCDSKPGDKQSWCHAELGACVKACDSTTTESVCMTNDLYKCEDGLFSYVDSCKEGCTVSDNSAECIKFILPKCINGTTKCVSSNLLSDSIMTCVDNSWSSALCLHNQVCIVDINKTATEPAIRCKDRICTNAAIQCSEDGKTLKQCNNNEWMTIGQCKDGFECKTGKCVAM